MKLEWFIIVSSIWSFCLTQLGHSQNGETAVNYSLVVYNPAQSMVGARNLNGGGGSVGFSFGQYLTLKGEFQGYSTTTLTFHLPKTENSPEGTFQSRGSMVTFLFGPQVNFPVGGKRIFAETLFGGANTGAYANLFKSAGITGLAAHNIGFAMAIGGGLDIGIAEHVGLRPVQLDYFMTRYEWEPLGINNQSNFRYQGGIVFFWGSSGSNRSN